MHGVFSRAHLCTVQSVARQCPYPAYKLWSSAGTGQHRSPHQNHTPAPPWQMMREIDITRISPQVTKIMTKKCSVSILVCKLFFIKTPTLVLFFSSQSGEGHSQWAWPFTSIQEAPKLQTKSSQDVGASGPVEEMVQPNYYYSFILILWPLIYAIASTMVTSKKVFTTFSHAIQYIFMAFSFALVLIMR